MVLAHPYYMASENNQLPLETLPAAHKVYVQFMLIKKQSIMGSHHRLPIHKNKWDFTIIPSSVQDTLLM